LFSELDYFEEAVDALLAHENVKTEAGIGIVGISKAAELCLILGAYLDDKVSIFIAIWQSRQVCCC
jgi:hypothetical protein